jgi:hypothetical protein
MRTLFLLMYFATISVTTLANRKNETENPIVGSWKFTSQSTVNDFQKVFGSSGNYQTQYFTFDANHQFKHDFLDKDNNFIKSMKGKWKFAGNKIIIEYSNVDYKLAMSYFYIGTDLVLGQNFNIVVFEKSNIDFQNVALK